MHIDTKPPGGHAEADSASSTAKQRSGQPISTASLRIEGARLLGEGKTREAAEIYAQIHALEPHDMGIAVMLGDIYRELDQLDQALVFYHKVMSWHATRKDYPKALILHKKVTELDPNNENLIEEGVQLCLLARQGAEPDKHQEHTSQAIQLLRSLAEFNIAHLDHDKAVSCFQRITELDPLDADASLALAPLLLRVNRRKDAVQHLISAARALLQKRMLAEAGKVIMEVSKLEDGNPDIKALFFRMQLAEGYVKVGLDGLHKLHRENPENMEVIQTLARAYVSFNQLEIACEWFSKAFAISEETAPLEHLANRLLDMGKPEGALKCLQPIIDRWLGTRNYRAAIETLLLIHRKGDHRPTLELLFKLYRLQDQPHEAIDALENLLNLYAHQGKGQEGLTYLWKLMEEDELSTTWRKRLEELASRFVSSAGKGARVRPFPEDRPTPGRSGEFQKLEHLRTLEDQLAAMPSRRLLKERLSQATRLARRRNKLAALLLIDLDRTRWENSGLDGERALSVLRECLLKIAGCIRETDTLGHLGGDEFALVLQGISGPRNIGRVVNLILSKLAEPIHIDNHTFKVVSAIGVAIYPNDGDQVGVLLQKADHALQRARGKGENTYALYTDQVMTQGPKRSGMERELYQAMERNQLELHYQPIFCLQEEGRLVGLEALLRWRHPELGLLYPSHFIGLAGECGFASQLGKWVLGNVVAQVRKWYHEGFEVPGLTMNITAEQCRDREFLQSIKRTMDSHGLPNGVLNLGIESGEALMLDDSEETRNLLTYLRRMGITLSIDDFGTGTASVVALKRSLVHMVKIDRSHVSQISDPNIADLVRALTALASGFGLEVVAEGIETAEQVAFLAGIGCHHGQGYYFERPSIAEKIESLLKRRGPDEVLQVG